MAPVQPGGASTGQKTTSGANRISILAVKKKKKKGGGEGSQMAQICPVIQTE